MIVVNGIIESTVETIEATRDAIHSMEQASRQEAGCIDYTFSVELNNPAVMRITEKWESMDDLRAHFGEPHMAEFRKALAANPPISSNVSFYEVTEIERP